MGTTVSSLQIHIGDDVAKAHQNVSAAIKTLMKRRSFVETTDTTLAKRAYYIVSKPDMQWIAIYNAHLGNLPDLEYITELEQIAVPLSGQIGYSLIHVDLYDDDVVNLRLFENGTLVDQFSNWLNYEELPKERIGHPEKWVSVLPMDATVQDFGEIWQPRNPNPISRPIDNSSPFPLVLDDAFEAFDILQRITNLLEMDEEFVFQTGDDFQFMNHDPDPDQTITTVYFQRGA